MPPPYWRGREARIEKLPFWINPQVSGKHLMLIKGHATRPHSGGVERSTRQARLAGALFLWRRREGRDSEARVDDWEKFFVEKSARRARRARWSGLIPMILWTTAVGAAVAGAIAAVAR